VSEQVKVGDKVWVLCEIKEALPDGFKVKGCSGGIPFWVLAEDCRPVDPPAIKANTKTANDQLRQSLMDYPLGEPSNSPEIPDSSSEPMREAFERFVVNFYDPNMEHLVRLADRYRDSETDMMWQAWKMGAGYKSSRIDQADPINPSHYKQGGIECIEAIKAATGDGFISYVWGNVLKYLWRWPKKGGVSDLKKARWYLDRLIREVGE
jgi:hypothetical protein